MSGVMRALRQETLAGPVDLRLVEDAVTPAPGGGEVLVKVAAAGVNFADVMQTRGTYHGGPQAPYLAGFEAAGEVVALGADVTAVEVGARVIGTGYGAFAEYMVMAADGIAPVPEGWRPEQALGLVLNWATALAALKPLGQLRAGQTVLVHAAAGAVGQAAVRMAKHYGATVIATASASKHEVVRRLGADHVIDYRTADLASEVRHLSDGKGVDVVLESVGGETFKKSLEVAKRVTGKVVVYGVAGGEASISNWELNFTHQVHVIGLHIGVLSQQAPDMFAELMAELSRLISIGVYPPGEPTVYDLADGPKALAELEARATVGKIALKP
ncbi:NADPH2:quinone reductase [Kribbella steppae]|uniref:NADPH2:quinone reductase n=1 Tax=Kribbella steppae TaxID=2512223 RepID=A0A4R2H0R7_9ACTN|nr:NADPH:quinone oxidoreductase family protein [Kribbella steppae]TCO18053.1 NADPH2:quinone reductase [Kribbella steppae]